MESKKVRVLVSAAALGLSACMITACGKQSASDASVETETTSDALTSEETATTEDASVEGATESADAATTAEKEADQEASTEGEVLHLEFPSQYLSEYDETGIYLSGQSQRIVVLNDGYEPLKEALQTEGDEAYLSMKEEYENTKLGIDEDRERDPNIKETIEDTITPTRVDEKVVSYYRTNYCYLGGAHPYTFVGGKTYDTQTGKSITLKEISKDYNAVYEYVLNAAKEYPYADTFFDDYEDTIHDLFYIDDDVISWFMDDEGVCVYFNQYDLAPYATGPVVINMPFKDTSDLWKDEYIKTPGDSYMKELTNWDGYVVDNEDGKVSLTANLSGIDIEDPSLLVIGHDDYDGDEGYYSNMLVYWQGTRTELQLDGFYSTCYFVQTKDLKHYLYVNTKTYNDYHLLEVIDLNEEKPLLLGVADGEAIYDQNVSSPDQMSLNTRIATLGTYYGYRNYKVGDDGYPVALEDTYRIVNYDYSDLSEGNENNYITLTTKKPITVKEVGAEEKGLEAGVNGKEVELPAGTKLIPYETDADTFMILMDGDGKKYRLDCTMREGMCRLSDGSLDTDIFDGIIYAG